jgi:prephenate dehydratase
MMGAKDIKNHITLGVSGEMGSFSEQAGLLYAEKMGIQPNLVYLTDMENVLAALETGQVDIGIFPVVNFRGGLVTMAFEAMGNHLFTPVDEIWLDVHQCLLAMPGTKSSDIKKIVSHYQALAQCKRFLQQEFKEAKLIEWDDTAKAAKDLSQGKLSKTNAVIAPERSAHVYQLDILAKNIQDDHPNLTAFIVAKQHT